VKDTLVRLLARLRLEKGVTFRQIEKETGISNAYLCQIENGDVSKPSPRILHKLADYYAVPYTELMVAAGYLEPRESRRAKENEILLMSEKLDDQQFEMARNFMKYLVDARKESEKKKK